MTAIKDLFASERGFLTLGIIIAATVLAAMAVMTVDQWTSFVQFIFVTYVGGKTVTGAVQILKGTPAEAEVATPANSSTTPV